MNNLLSYCGLVDEKIRAFWQSFTCNNNNWLHNAIRSRAPKKTMDFAKSQTKSQKTTNLNNENQNWKSEKKKKRLCKGHTAVVSEGIF